VRFWSRKVTFFREEQTGSPPYTCLVDFFPSAAFRPERPPPFSPLSLGAFLSCSCQRSIKLLSSPHLPQNQLAFSSRPYRRLLLHTLLPFILPPWVGYPLFFPPSPSTTAHLLASFLLNRVMFFFYARPKALFLLPFPRFPSSPLSLSQSPLEKSSLLDGFWRLPLSPFS